MYRRLVRSFDSASSSSGRKAPLPSDRKQEVRRQAASSSLSPSPSSLSRGLRLRQAGCVRLSRSSASPNSRSAQVSKSSRSRSSTGGRSRRPPRGAHDDDLLLAAHAQRAAQDVHGRTAPTSGYDCDGGGERDGGRGPEEQRRERGQQQQRRERPQATEQRARAAHPGAFVHGESYSSCCCQCVLIWLLVSLCFLRDAGVHDVPERPHAREEASCES